MLPVSGACAVDRLGRDVRGPAGELGERGVVEVGQPRDRRAGTGSTGPRPCLRLQLLDDGRQLPLRRRTPALGAKLLVGGFRGQDPVVEEGAHALGVVVGHGAGCEVHTQHPTTRHPPTGQTRIRGPRIPEVPQFRIADAARLLGAATTPCVGGWIRARCRCTPTRPTARSSTAPRSPRSPATTPSPLPTRPTCSARPATGSSASSTSVVSDKVMSQVEKQRGPHRVVSLMSTEAVGDLGL